MLPPHSRLGTFEVLAPLGKGGMGEVYRARDTRLGREVALKVLPAERLSDPARRARFLQEARSASALNHPNIVTVYEIESADGVDFLVMELVPGEPLDQQIPKGGMRLDRVLRLAIPIADALAAAHARGIVHRDLKPANVMVTPEGVVKVLDFGLAKLLPDSGRHEGTTLDAQVASEPGAVSGTPAYMSPEQATGGTVDTRSDVFAFGVLLYEMVTGERPFAGRSSAEVHAALLREQPKVPSERVKDVPKELERIILRCLRKEPDRRFQHMSDVKVELQEVKEESDSSGSAPTAAVPAPGRRRVPVGWLAGGAALAALLGGALWRLGQPPPAAPKVVQLSSERWAGAGSFSPDGKEIAYASAGDDGANWDVWIRLVGRAEARRLTTDPAPEDYPAWSPDGTEIAFLRYNAGNTRGFTAFAAGTIHVVSPLGGQPRRLSDFPARLQLAWSRDGRWLAAAKARVGDDPAGGIFLISPASGEARALTTPKAEAFDTSPSFAPDGRELAYVSCEGPYTAPLCDLYVQPLDSELRPRGAVRRLTRERLKGTVRTAWTRDGRYLLYDGIWRVRKDGGVPPERLEPAAGGRSPAVASTGERLAYVRPVGDMDIHRLPLGGAPAPIIQWRSAELQPQYSPDGRRVAFLSTRAEGVSEIWLADADGRNPTRLTRGPGRGQGWPGWAPDGRAIVFDSVGEDENRDVWVIGADGSGLRRLTRDPAADLHPSWSRDGRFVYFASDRTGAREIWRIPSAGGAEEQLTHGGGQFPLESFDGQTLYYLKSDDGGPLVARSKAGGDERTVLPCVRSFGFAVAPGGIVHHDCFTEQNAGSPQRELRFWDARTGQDRVLASVTTDAFGNLSVAPDGRSLVYAGGVLTSDLMMIEGFR